MTSLYPYFRALLFRLDPERAHALSLGLMRLVGSLPPLAAVVRAWFAAPEKPVRVFGLEFKNPVGLAAGYDKDGLAWRGLACLGFSHIEVGTVTLKPQAGNPRPRLARLPRERALVNRLGFPSRGLEFLIRRVRGTRPSGLLLGLNLGVNKDTPLEMAAQDYLELLERCASLADYLVVNVSSPNTIGLRRLQGRQALEGLLSQLAQRRRALLEQSRRCPPLLVKLAPDLTDAELDDALQVVEATGMDGVIAANTTLSRAGVEPQSLARSAWAARAGGLSGSPLRSLSTAMVRKIHARSGGRLPIIAAGGVMGALDAREKLEAGAALVQVYTGLVYQGPGLVKEILQGL